MACRVLQRRQLESVGGRGEATVAMKRARIHFSRRDPRSTALSLSQSTLELRFVCKNKAVASRDTDIDKARLR